MVDQFAKPAFTSHRCSCGRDGLHPRLSHNLKHWLWLCDGCRVLEICMMITPEFEFDLYRNWAHELGIMP